VLTIFGSLLNLAGIVLLFLFEMPFRVAPAVKTATWNASSLGLQVKNLDDIYTVDTDRGRSISILVRQVAFFSGPKDRGKFNGFVRRSPNRFQRAEDGALVLDLLRRAESQPVPRPVDPKKLACKPLYRVEQRHGKAKVPVTIAVPEREEEAPTPGAPAEQVASTTRHTEMQYYLLQLGADMGLDLWVARNDRSKLWNGAASRCDTPNARGGANPVQRRHEQNHRTHRRALVRGNSIVAAFEIESTTSIYSGLLRMSDLLALQPNIDIRLYLVAPDDRRDKVEQEILRPTYSKARTLAQEGRETTTTRRG
jgi:hypothetical protein